MSCCISSKHGLSLVGMPVLGGLERQILKTMLRTYAAARCVGGSALSICSKLGLLSATFHCEVSLVFWTGVFLSPGRRIRVIGKETGPGPGGYG